MKKNNTIVDLKEDLKREERETGRLKVVVRRQEKQIEQLMPQKEDVCLSARSFSESRLIDLREPSVACAG